jgi:hypothetical protein
VVDATAILISHAHAGHWSSIGSSTPGTPRPFRTHPSTCCVCQSVGRGPRSGRSSTMPSRSTRP